MGPLKTFSMLTTCLMICGAVYSAQAAGSGSGSMHTLFSGGQALEPVRAMLNNGQAKFQIVDKRVLPEKTEVEVVLTDAQGRTIGGYAPPYISSGIDARLLWKDFVASGLALPSSPDQLTIREERKSMNESFAVAFVLDHSPSMTVPRALRMQRAIQQALTTFNENDYVSVVKFTGRVTTEVPVTKSREEYLSKFKTNGLNLRSDGTAIYDATREGIAQIASVPNSKRVVIVFTDGEDNSSSADLDDVVKDAMAANAQVFSVTYGVNNDEPLVKLANATGGRVHRLHDVGDFDRVFLGIYNSLRHTYIVSVDTKAERRQEEIQSAVTSFASAGMSTVRASEVMALMPKEHVQIAPQSAADQALVVNVDLNFADANNVSPADVPLLDSVATVLIQRNDLSLEILGSADAANSAEDNATAHRRAQAIRDVLVRRGVHPSRVQGFGNTKTQPANTVPAQVGSGQRKTTFVFTKM